MVRSVEDVYGGLYQVFDRIDKTKVYPAIGPIPDGRFLEVTVSDSAFCPFRIEVTPYLFDIAVSVAFSSSDVLHGCVDYRNIIEAIAAGKVNIAKTPGFLMFGRARLSVDLPDGVGFFMDSGWKLSTNNITTRKFSSYLL